MIRVPALQWHVVVVLLKCFFAFLKLFIYDY
jgi:hypothetical protein